MARTKQDQLAKSCTMRFCLGIGLQGLSSRSNSWVIEPVLIQPIPWIEKSGAAGGPGPVAGKHPAGRRPSDFFCERSQENYPLYRHLCIALVLSSTIAKQHFMPFMWFRVATFFLFWPMRTSRFHIRQSEHASFETLVKN